MEQVDYSGVADQEQRNQKQVDYSGVADKEQRNQKHFALGLGRGVGTVAGTSVLPGVPDNLV